jgi:hypothetical protein
MENNESKHSPLPWKLTDSYKTGIISDGKLIASLYCTKNLDELDVRLDGESWLAMRDRTKKEREFYTKIQPEANAEFIVTACNNYQALKEENTLLKEVNEAQIFTIEKYQKQNEEYMAMLELIRDCYKTDAKGALDRGNTTTFNYYSNQATQITNLLTKHSK